MCRVRMLGPSRAKLTLRDISKGALTTRVLFGAGSIYSVVLWRVPGFFQISFRRGGMLPVDSDRQCGNVLNFENAFLHDTVWTAWLRVSGSQA